MEKNAKADTNFLLILTSTTTERANQRARLDSDFAQQKNCLEDNFCQGTEKPPLKVEEGLSGR